MNCLYGGVPGGGTPQVCTTNSWRCTQDGGYLKEQQCNSDGSSWKTPISCIADYSCNSNIGRCESTIPICTGGQITSACLCNNVLYTSGYCCNGIYKSVACN